MYRSQFICILVLFLFLETISYSEDTLVSREPPNEQEIKISDIATKVFKNSIVLCLTHSDICLMNILLGISGDITID